MPLSVKDVMGDVAIAVLEQTTFADIVAVMARYRVGAVTVVDGERRPVGVVSEDDLLLRETEADRRDPSGFQNVRSRNEYAKTAGVTAAQIMTSPPIVVTPGTAARMAAQIMHENKIKQLPVIDPMDGHIVGTILRSDLLKVFNRPVIELYGEIVTVLKDQVLVDPERLLIDIRDGMVSVAGIVERHSQIAHLTEAIRRIEGVVDLRVDLAYDRDDVGLPPE
ncbi:CBS domain-containing protein [Rhizohabitans arisaemae]|uniref:CBS domain-containing protein n=1 Tax=Rhizohabitans arisaemae TaxID=2720610 RepID=UPI0024B16B0B|nr:CBS domain-containing protein [Rhizohabitans arisaemae]